MQLNNEIWIFAIIIIALNRITFFETLEESKFDDISFD